MRFRKLLVTNEIEFKEGLALPSEEELEAAGAPIRPAAIGDSSTAMMSGNEIRALEDKIKSLQAQNSQKDKQIASLDVNLKALKDQIASQTIENFNTI